MSDISAIIGTILGFIVAFLADPIKNTILNFINVRLLRKAIYSELISIYDRAVTFLDEKERKKLYSNLDTAQIKTISNIYELFIQLDKETFLYARKKQPLLFYRLDEAILISIVFSDIDYYQRLEKDHIQDSATIESELVRYATLLKESFETLFKHKLFDQRLLIKLSRRLKCQNSLEKVLGK